MKKTNRLIKFKKNLKQICENPINIEIKKFSNDFMKCICDCAFNILKGNIKLSNEEKNKLIIYRNLLHDLSNNIIPISKRREILTRQVGGGFYLPLIILPVLKILNNLL